MLKRFFDRVKASWDVLGVVSVRIDPCGVTARTNLISFGYQWGEVSASQRTANETAVVLERLNSGGD